MDVIILDQLYFRRPLTMNVITFFRRVKHQVISSVASLHFNGKIEQGINANRLRNLILNAYRAYKDDNGQNYATKRAWYLYFDKRFLYFIYLYLAKDAVTSYYNK